MKTLPVAMALAMAGAAAAGGGCDPKTPAAKACCEQPKIAPDVTPFVVVGDEASGDSDAQRVVLEVGLSRPATRDQLYPVLQTLYVHAMKRGSFEPIHFEGKVYATESAARTGGEQGLVGRIIREQSDIAPKCENLIRYDFAEQVARAFAASVGRGQEEDTRDTCHMGERKIVARADDKFTHKPSYKIDAARHAMELTYPYLSMGKDEYQEKLKLASAMRDWVEQLTLFFGKVDQLAEMTFIGVANDEPVVKITVTRPQFDSSLSALQEAIASHANVTFASLGLHRKDDKAAAKEQDSFQSQTYKAALAKLPKNQVFVSPKLK
jgi:hypothetical protein